MIEYISYVVIILVVLIYWLVLKFFDTIIKPKIKDNADTSIHLIIERELRLREEMIKRLSDQEDVVIIKDHKTCKNCRINEALDDGYDLCKPCKNNPGWWMVV